MSKKYTRQALVDAVASNLGSKAAAIKFNVPASTICEHRRESSINVRVGRPSYLTSDQENHLVSLLKLLPDYGFHITKDLALELAADYSQSLGLTTKPGKKWLYSLVNRHADDIIWKKQEKLERARAESFTEESRLGWFSTLKNVLVKHDLLDKPNQIFNADETGFSDTTKGQWVIVNSSCRHAFESSGGTGKDYRTALICIAAGGQVLPPFILYAGCNLIDSWCKGGPPGSRYAVTKKGWIDTCMYEYWLENLFIPSTVHLNRPLLLVIDGHTSHISLKIIDLLRANQIICLMLPSHSTHALQPLDLVVFNAVKQDWSKIVKNHLREGNKRVKNADFARLMKKLFIDKAAFSPTRIVSSFARAGIWPYDENAMREKVAQSTARVPTTTSTETPSVPANILQPQLISSTSSTSTSSAYPSSSSLSLTTTSSTFPVSNPVQVFTSNDPIQSSPLSNTFGEITPLQPTILIDEDDLLDSVTGASYTTLESCPLDLSLNLQSRKRKTPSSNSLSRKSSRVSASNNSTPPSTSTPIVAVRRVMNTLLSQRTKELEKIHSQTKASRGKRLTSKIGLNITDDEFVLMKIKESEEKKHQKQKSRVSKDSNTTGASNTTTTTVAKRRGRPPKKTAYNNTYSKDADVEASICSLQSVIDMANNTLNSNDSDEDWN